MNITFTYSKRKTLTLTVKPTGEVLVRAPKRMSKIDIENFVRKHMAWIAKRQAAAQSAKKQFVDGENFWYLGEQYPLRMFSPYHRNKIDWANNQFNLYLTTPAPSYERIKKIFEQWYKKQAEKYIGERIKILSTQMNLYPGRITIRNTHTRWGSCSSRGNINFSLRLIMAPPTVIDYVIIHELAHLAHKNHSKKFWELVGNYFSDYKAARKWLRVHEQLLVI